MLVLFRMEKIDLTRAQQRDRHVNPDRGKRYKASDCISLILHSVSLDSSGLEGGNDGWMTILTRSSLPHISVFRNTQVWEDKMNLISR
jgi:hypothetical protein